MTNKFKNGDFVFIENDKNNIGIIIEYADVIRIKILDGELKYKPEEIEIKTIDFNNFDSLDIWFNRHSFGNANELIEMASTHPYGCEMMDDSDTYDFNAALDDYLKTQNKNDTLKQLQNWNNNIKTISETLEKYYPEELCEILDVDYFQFQREIFTYYAISDHLATWLKTVGCIIIEVCGFNIWGRTTFGQLCTSDYEVQEAFKNYLKFKFNFHSEV